MKKQNQFEQILMNKYIICKTQTFYILLTFLLITMALLIAVSIYCYRINNKQSKNIYYFYHVTNNELREISINKRIINMDSDDELKKIDIKNCRYHYFGDMIKLKILILTIFS